MARAYLLPMLLGLVSSALAACPPPFSELMVTMRDGKSLAVDYYVPSTAGAVPAILVQTPYNRKLFRVGLPLGIRCDLDSSPYAWVIADWRGFFGSSGAAVVGYNRGLDGYDLVQWIAAQSWSNGNVATWGISALGVIQYQTAGQQPPALRCIMPMAATMATKYLDYYPGGTARVEYLEQMDELGFAVSTTTYNNPYKSFYWAVVEASTTYIENITVPALLMAGWHDHNLVGMLDLYEQLRESGTSAAAKHRLLIGPWAHGSFGDARVGNMSFPEAEKVNDQRMIEWLDWCLLGNSENAQTRAPITYFAMGDNKWHTANSWPPSTATPTTLYLHDNYALSTVAPTSSAIASFLYAPEDPSPTVGGATLLASLEQGPYDQGPKVESRGDGAIFSTAVLAEPLRVQGAIKVYLKFASTSTDTDVVVRLTDVHPDGTSFLIVEQPLRMRMRLGMYTAATKALLTPNTFYSVNLTLPDTANTFLPGHRLRIIVTSSNYPRFNRNCNNGLDPMYPSKDGHLLVEPVLNVTNSLSLDGSSYLFVPTVPNGAIATPTPTSSVSVNASARLLCTLLALASALPLCIIY